MVNVVHRTNVAHHPYPYDPTPSLQDISVYYGELVYGGVNFAILADRQWKSGPENVDTGGGRADHVTDKDIDTLSLNKPGLALLDAGKRDVPYDLDQPVPLARLDADGTRHPLGTSTTDARIDAVNDQHAFLDLESTDPLAVGDLVCLGISHPCTTFDKWRSMPVVDDQYRVTEVITTLF